MKLIVGLGNPGPKYQLTRHNIGFLVIDALAEIFSGSRTFKNEFKSETQKIQIAGQPVLIAKPQTYMNLSGEAVQPMLSFYNIAREDLLVVHDEVDLPFEAMRFQTGRGHGGHNGIRNIHLLLGGNDYARLRVGVGKPPQPGPPVSDWVLQNFTKDEVLKMPDVLSRCSDGIEVFVSSGLGKAATQFNAKGD